MARAYRNRLLMH